MRFAICQSSWLQDLEITANLGNGSRKLIAWLLQCSAVGILQAQVWLGISFARSPIRSHLIQYTSLFAPVSRYQALVFSHGSTARNNCVICPNRSCYNEKPPGHHFLYPAISKQGKSGEMPVTYTGTILLVFYVRYHWIVVGSWPPVGKLWLSQISEIQVLLVPVSPIFKFILLITSEESHFSNLYGSYLFDNWDVSLWSDNTPRLVIYYWVIPIK